MHSILNGYFDTPQDYADVLRSAPNYNLGTFDEVDTEENSRMDYGTKRHSGRYPYGSGDNPFQHEPDWYGTVQRLRKEGLSDNDIAKLSGLTSGQFRAKVSNERAKKRTEDRARAVRLKEKGYSTTEIARIMFDDPKKESTIRSLLDEDRAKRNDLTRQTADSLKAFVEQKRYLDVGTGTEIELNVPEQRLKNAIKLLEEEGYKVQYLRVEQMGTGHKTTIKVLTKDDVPWQELHQHQYDIQTVGSKVIDTDDARMPSTEVRSVSSDRIFVKYAEDGGTEKDGLIEVRRGVDDISLGNALYAQVRIGVDDTHYMKGMCVYSDDIPDGYDIIYNSNKAKGSPKDKVFKKMKTDQPNPFGASIYLDDGEDGEPTLTQRYYIDKNGKKQLSAINVVHEEGDWAKWKKTLSSQMASKQNVQLAKRQLNLDYASRVDEFNDICKLTNPTIKRTLLLKFADGCDAAAVDLHAAPLPRQATHVLIPFPELKDNEIYAPNYKDGEQVVLIRYPHGGTFEIPQLTVRNKGSVAEKTIKNAPDAVGINLHVAERLSGADFDGDTVVVIPVGDNVKIRTTPQLQGLKDFDDKKAYPGYEGMKVITPKAKQTEMGKVSNLITDMTLMGAPDDELARAVRHSMVIIDAEKHELDYKRSFEENRIAELKERYQGGRNAGAGTIISRAGGRYDVPERKGYSINPETGAKEWIETKAVKAERKKDKVTGEYYNTGKIKPVMQKSTKMAETDDAYKLTSGGSKEHPGYLMEAVYANYANQMKALGNKARKEYLTTPKLVQNKEAKEKYAAERKSLMEKVKLAKSNAPKERQAQLYANKLVKTQLAANPDLDEEHRKKIKGQSLTIARDRIGAKKPMVQITDNEWEAIQSGAISDSMLTTILENTKLEDLKQRATPRSYGTIPASKQAKIRAMQLSGYSTKEIADACGISASTVNRYLTESKKSGS